MSNKAIILTMLGVLVTALAVTIFVGGDSNKPDEVLQASYILPVDSERSFLEQMIPHYQAAVVISEELLKDPVALRPLRELAEVIVASRSGDVEKMVVWYQDWYGQPYQKSDNYQPKTHTLSGLSATERERIYLEDIESHSQAASSAAQAVLVLDSRTETREWAKTVIVRSGVEITKIAELLKLLPTE